MIQCTIISGSSFPFHAYKMFAMRERGIEGEGSVSSGSMIVNFQPKKAAPVGAV